MYTKEKHDRNWKEVARRSEAGEYDATRRIFREMLSCDDPEIVDDLEKRMICVNMASLDDREGNISGALNWYDEAIKRYENSDYWATEKKAYYLAEKDRLQEAITILQGLLAKPELSWETRARVIVAVAGTVSRYQAQL